MKNIDKQLEIISRGAEEIIGAEELKKKLLEGKQLRVKFGADPTAPELHLGHTVVMEKLKAFQDLGHMVIFIIGDFTAMIGDPSGRTSERRMLAKEDIEKSVKGYKKQIFKVLNTENIEIVKNSVWLEKLGAEGLIRLSTHYTVARMLERNDFEARYKRGDPITITEFIYPLLQGYDSVQVKADIEIGGTDQKFNLLMGRLLQKDMGQEPQSILTMPLLEGTDGVKKMSKSYRNHIGIDESPEDIFGKIMSISDELMYKYYNLLTNADIERIKKLHPMEAKKKLAFEIVSKYYTSDAAIAAKEGFERVFSKRKLPEKMQVYILPEPRKLVDIIYNQRMLDSKAEIKRHIRQGAITFNEEKVMDSALVINPGSGGVLKVGKRKFLRIK